MLIIRCPVFGTELHAGSVPSQAALKSHWNSDVVAYCPHCRADHTAKVRDAFISDMLSRVQLIGPEHARLRSSDERVGSVEPSPQRGCASK